MDLFLMTFGRNIQKNFRIEFAYFSFHVCCFFSQLFGLSNRAPKITVPVIHGTTTAKFQMVERWTGGTTW